MTCQCTCGKHILIDTSKSVIMANPAANAAAGGPAVVFHGTTGAFQGNLVTWNDNLTGANPTVPPLLIEP